MPGRDGLQAECVLVYSAVDFLKWRVMLERNGEMSEERRSLLRDMERYAARVGCRHGHIVGYFGEQYDRESCGACDYCLGELEPVQDAVTLARKILSAVARVGQRFGTAHVTNVLRGSDAENVRGRGHDQLSTFGLLKEATTRRSARVHRSTARAWIAAADRRRLPGAAVDGERVRSC